MRCSAKLPAKLILAFDVQDLVFHSANIANSSSDNHKPDPASHSSLSSLQLQPSDSDLTGYDLSFSDNSENYKYNGVRTTGDGKYVLIFDPEKQHFVLHRIDSTFDMNLVSAPWEENESTLRSQYPQLESTVRRQPEAPQRKTTKPSKNTPVAKPEPKRRKSAPIKKKPPVREPTPEEDEDSDDGLTIEYPDAPPSKQNKYQPPPVFQQNVNEEVSDEDEDAEGEEYEEEEGNQDVDHLKLPSPANNNSGGMSDEDIELDLEAELEQALKETTEGAGEDESDESEEE
jgi:hypothetical protein